MKIAAVIPARGGSKRLPRKNILPLKGIPLISHTIRQALKSKIFSVVAVSTEDQVISEISRDEGAFIIVRPPHLAEDVESELVMQHALTVLNHTYAPDIVMMLQCTSPLRRPETLIKVKEAFEQNWDKADSVLTVHNIEGYRPEWMCYINKNNEIIPYTDTWRNENGKPVIKLVARQDLPTLYKQNGCVYATKATLIKEGKIVGSNCFAVEIDVEEAHDIDDEFDFMIAEELLKRRIYGGE